MFELVEHPDGSPVTYNNEHEVKLVRRSFGGDQFPSAYIMVGGCGTIQNAREVALTIAEIYEVALTIEDMAERYNADSCRL